MTEDSEKRRSITVGRYLLHRQIARGGMATIHIARLMGDEGFSRIVAAKRLLPELAEDTEFVAMFMDEARIASKVHHPNVVPVLDLVTTTDEVMLVQEYVHGVPLHVLLRTARDAGKKIPVRIAISIAAQVLAGLHAAHTTLDEMGAPLDIVHRDVSPQNIMIAVDGSARLLDFGVAKATMAAHTTRDNTFKGKLAYAAPEQVHGKPVQQSDLYALAVVLWELLVGHRMHGSAQGEAELVATILKGELPTITEALANEADWGAIDSEEWKQLSAIEPIVQKGLEIDLDKRFATAEDMEDQLTKAVTPASSSEVATWVKSLGKDFIEGRDKIIAAEEASWRKTLPPLNSSVRRQTSGPGEIKRPSTGDLHPAVSHPPWPAARKTTAIIAVLGALVLVLGVGVVFAMQGGDTPRPATSEAATPPEHIESAAAAQPTTPSADPSKPEQQAVPVATTDSGSAASTASPDVAMEKKPAAKEAPPVRRLGLRPAPRAVKAALVKEKAKEPAPAPAPVPVKAVAPEAQPADDCNPPYYFEGQKKIFKPNCL